MIGLSRSGFGKDVVSYLKIKSNDKNKRKIQNKFKPVRDVLKDRIYINAITNNDWNKCKQNFQDINIINKIIDDNQQMVEKKETDDTSTKNWRKWIGVS